MWAFSTSASTGMPQRQQPFGFAIAPCVWSTAPFLYVGVVDNLMQRQPEGQEVGSKAALRCGGPVCGGASETGVVANAQCLFVAEASRPVLGGMQF